MKHLAQCNHNPKKMLKISNGYKTLFELKRFKSPKFILSISEIYVLGMCADQQQSWTIYLHAKAKSFKLKFKATNFRFFQFYLLLNLSPLLIRVRSQPMQISLVRKRNTLRSRLVRVLRKFQIRPIKNKSVSARFRKLTNHKQPKWDCFKGTIGVTSLIITNLVLLSPLLFANDEKRIVILCLIIFLYVVAFLKRVVPTKGCILMIVMNVAMVGYSSLLQRKNNFSYISLLRYAWKAWNWINSSQSSYVPQEFRDIFANLGKFI